MSQRRLSVTTAIAVGCLLTLVAASASIAAAKSGGTIHACAKKSTGALRIAKRCTGKERAVSWGKTGPRGQRGARGSIGPAGPAAVKLYYSGGAGGNSVFTTSFGDWKVSIDCVADIIDQTNQLNLNVQQASGVSGASSFESSSIHTVNDGASTSSYTHGTVPSSPDVAPVGGTSTISTDNGSRVVGTVVLTTATGSAIGQITYSARILNLADNVCRVAGLAVASGN